jgi:copper resistance protein C
MSKPTTSWFHAVRRSSAPILAALTLTAALAAAPAVPASAHTKLTASTPADGARLTASPTSLSFTFDQNLQPVQEWDAVLVSGPDSFRHPARSVQVEGNTVRASCDRLGESGSYTVSYRVISGDGHPIAGHISLTLDRPDAGSPALAAVDLPSGTVPAWVCMLELATVLLVLGGFLRWRSDQSQDTRRPVLHNHLDAATSD